MSNKILFTLTAIALALIGIIFVLNIYSLLTPYRTNEYFNPNDVEGSAVFHKEQLFTLNFEQQNRLLNFINEVILIENIEGMVPFSSEKIVLYLFNNKELVLEPIGVLKENLIFKADPWKKNGYMSEQSSGAFLELISETYDK